MTDSVTVSTIIKFKLEFGVASDPTVLIVLNSVAYLGFRKGGAKFSLATSAHTKGGAKPSFPIFLVCQKKFFLAKGGAMAQWPPPKYATG